MQIKEIFELLEVLKKKGMQVELFERPRKYATAMYDIRNSNGIIIKSVEMLKADLDAVIFDKYKLLMQRQRRFVSELQYGSIQKISETYLLKDAAGIQIGWFDLAAGRKGIEDATIALRQACLKHAVLFKPDIPSAEPFPHKQRHQKKARLC
jgi:hypothetical protein